ncbi:hypothetical protein MIND_00589000 [Mycena indigotica]|uniref:Uncharacterized protein n=1 Tax=Mycena indigotica TaxID=2126181 RepID=A0A8H6SSJ0_9AGAR|nr:uncharacterized protein MIND_00589000 [Mycena indigotica]KAF7303597.1 hypothetical protein MIND_00589000 [Mycena indigotica]
MEGATTKHMPSFLWQTSRRYTSPEMTIVLSPTEGRLTLGGRPPDLPSDKRLKYHWKTAGEISSSQSEWTVDCPYLTMNDTKYPIKTGKVLFDTGAASIYLDESIVVAYYSHFPDTRLDDKGYHLISLANKEPKQTLNVDFHFKEDKLWLFDHIDPTSDILDFDGKQYQRGAIQSTSVLHDSDKDPWTGPCLIGRIAMYNADLNLHFAPGTTPKIFFREKKSRAEDDISQRPYDWGKF